MRLTRLSGLLLGAGLAVVAGHRVQAQPQWKMAAPLPEAIG
jgi:hypothetical protein